MWLSSTSKTKAHHQVKELLKHHGFKSQKRLVTFCAISPLKVSA
ncbi:hypothetical protein PARC_p0004 (plasmid) [Pseudoalteromonas arctica A 37-1-2]|uniref:Uncharacterized protein n=1 Tax=Pseudoalteromonas arctica A 37-1-2 TaxID=1117313 RepID=A0A290SA65_9GAMM|nr:hypothetical protein PARC_p0004 [Pseudoalteromonas arctica A 37-1-2]